MALKTLDDRRRATRVQLPGRVELEVPHRTLVAGSSLNLSEGGLCVRVEESLDVRAPVTLRLFPQPRSRPLECTGRIAWVVQRSDLRTVPPPLYDVGVQFVRTSARLRQLASRLGVILRDLSTRAPRPSTGAAGKLVKHSSLQPTALRGRNYEPRLIHELAPHSAWHLVVKVDGAPCFSRHYPSEREGLDGWKQFKRQLGKRSGR